MTDKIIAYMDKADWEAEAGYCPNGNEIFYTVEQLLENRPCAEFCGVVEVEITLKRVVIKEKE